MAAIAINQWVETTPTPRRMHIRPGGYSGSGLADRPVRCISFSLWESRHSSKLTATLPVSVKWTVWPLSCTRTRWWATDVSRRAVPNGAAAWHHAPSYLSVCAMQRPGRTATGSKRSAGLSGRSTYSKKF